MSDCQLRSFANAVLIAKIATGEIDDITTDDGKNAAAVAHGRQGAGGWSDAKK